MSLERRTVQVYDLPIYSDISILRPEQVIVRFSNGKTVDIGALCYLIRQPITKSRLGPTRVSNTGRLVQIDSLYEQRRHDIRLIISFISEQIEKSGKRVETIRDMLSRFVTFVFWADQHKFYNLLTETDVAKQALIQYTQYLKEKTLRNEISINSSARQQSAIRIFLCAFFENDELTLDIQKIRKNPRQANNTHPPCETAQARVLALCEHVFDGITDLVLENKFYPFQLKMPSYLNYPQNRLWIFPLKTWFIHPDNELNKRNKNLCFNFKNGTLNTLEQIASLRLQPSKNNYDNNLIFNNAKKLIKEVNLNFRHKQRLKIGAVAANAFLILFLAQTGMSWSQLVNLHWNNDFEILSTRQLFRTVKWRAGGKECNFELPIGFIPQFKRYLELRKYLTENEKIEYLFFASEKRGVSKTHQIKSLSLYGIYRTFHRLDPNLYKIQSREWRVAKSDWLIRNTDIATTAQILQNTEKTVLSSYIEGSESVHWEEMSNFLDSISKIILPPHHDQKQLLQSAIGKCSSFGNPVIPQENNSINTPNCINPEGCLFCENYKIHVDETDIRKLLSCQYCIEKTVHLIGNLEEQNLVTKPIFERINLIISHVKKNNEQLVNKIMSEVEDGELDVYWARKLEMFMELDWII